MRPDTQLDFAIFQLTPNQDRCELHVVAHGQSYRLASGLLKPFLAHLSALEDQISQGGQSIRLEPSNPSSAVWFTKGTVERFVRFVSTPEVLERVSTIEMELIEVAEAIRAQANIASELAPIGKDDASKTTDSPLTFGGNSAASDNLGQTTKVQESMDDMKDGLEEKTQWLLRALDARWMMLLKEQEMAFVRAIGAGFVIKNVGDLVLFAEDFGAYRLREACIRFMALCQRRQESGMWTENIDQVTGPVNQVHGLPYENKMQFIRPNKHPDAWPDIPCGDAKLMELRRASFPIDGLLPVGENGVETLREGSMDGELQQRSMMGVYNSDYSNTSAWSVSRQDLFYRRNHLDPLQEMHSAGLGRGEYIDVGVGRTHGLGRGQPPQGQPQSQYIQGNPAYRAAPYAHPSSFGIPMPAQGGLGYPQALENPYVCQSYSKRNQWQMHAGPPQFWPGNQGDNKSPQQIMNVHKMEGTLNTSSVVSSQHEGIEANYNSPQSIIDEHTVTTIVHTSATVLSQYSSDNQGESTSPQPILSEQKMDETVSHQSNAVSRGEAVLPQKEVHEQPISMSTPAELITSKESTQLPGNDVLNNELVHETLVAKEEISEDSQNLLHPNDDQSYKSNGVSVEMDENPTVRRLPRRASSPSRRSVSPMRKVQIARSGPASGYRRSRSFSKRSIYSTHNVVDNATESSESESEDDKHVDTDDKAKQEEVVQVRMRVQDVIGLFERKKEDSSDAKVQPINRKLSSKNSVLRRWSEDGVHSEPHSSLSVDNNASMTVQKNLFAEETGSKLTECTNGIDHLAEQEEKIEKQTTASEIIPGGHRLEQPADDAFITFEPCVSEEMHNLSKDVVLVQDGHDTKIPCENHGDDVLKDQIKDADEPQSVNSIAVEHINGISQEKSDKKISDKETKVKGMQEMLEKRKTSPGGKGNKQTPLAMAQSRAEKLRVYKACLQQSKKEKEEEERKRIEGLKIQRRERIVSRTTPINGPIPDTTTTITTPTKRTPRNPSLNGGKSLPTVSPKKSNSNTSPHLCPPDGSANPLSPRGKSSRYTTSKSARELNALSQSVPSLNDISKENLTGTVLTSTASLRASTGSQRFSQLQKKTLKDEDSNNREEIIKKRPVPVSAVTAIRKGILPAVKENTPKGEISSTSQQKSSKVNSPTSVASKHKKRAVKSSEKETVLENDKGTVTIDSESINVVNDISVSGLVSADGSNLEVTKEQLNAEADKAEADGNLNTVVYDVDSMQEQESNYAQSRTVLLAESAVPTSPPSVAEISDVNSNVKESVLATSDEVMNDSPQDLKDTSYVLESSFNSESVSECTLINVEQTKDSESAKFVRTKDYHASVAHVSSIEDNNIVINTEENKDYEKDKAVAAMEIPARPLFPSLQDEPLNEPSVVTSSKSLPRLLEAIQQAHSPEAYPIQSNKTRKKWGEPGSQKSKDNQQAKGLKRLLFLGRKSHRGSSTHNSIEADGGIDELRDMITSHNSGKNQSDSIFVSSFGNQVTSSSSGIKDNVTGSSSAKGSRSFFSLSALRGKAESKA